MNNKTISITYLHGYADSVRNDALYFIDLGNEIYQGMEGVGESDVLAYYFEEIITTILQLIESADNIK